MCVPACSRARVYFQSVEVSPSWTPHRLSVRTGLTVPPLRGSGEFRAVAGVESVSDAGLAGDGAAFA